MTEATKQGFNHLLRVSELVQKMISTILDDIRDKFYRKFPRVVAKHLIHDYQMLGNLKDLP